MDNKPDEQFTNTDSANTPVVNTPAPTATPTESAKESDVEFSEQTMMAALSYLGPLVFVPLLMKKEDPFVHFHIKQGLVLFGIEAIIWLISNWFMSGIIYGIWPLISLLNLVLLVLSIIGIINALKHVEKQIPVLGKFASHIKV